MEELKDDSFCLIFILLCSVEQKRTFKCMNGIKDLTTFDGDMDITLSVLDLKIVFHLHRSTNLQKTIKP